MKKFYALLAIAPLLLAACSKAPVSQPFIVTGTVISASDLGISTSDVVFGGAFDAGPNGGVSAFGSVATINDDGTATFEVEFTPSWKLVEFILAHPVEVMLEGGRSQMGTVPSLLREQNVECATSSVNPATLQVLYSSQLMVGSAGLENRSASGDVRYAYIFSSESGQVKATCAQAEADLKVTAANPAPITYDVDLALVQGWNRASLTSTAGKVEVRIIQDVNTQQEWREIVQPDSGADQ